jgi:sugar/nucleoside kinase (ribokinase family)
MTIVAADRDRARLSFHHPGSGRGFAPDRIPSELMDAGATVLLSGYHLLLGMRGDPGAAFLAVARAAGVTTAVDVGPIVPPPATAGEWQGLLPQTDYLIGNEYELLTCTGADTLQDASEALLTLGAGAVVAKRGGSGAAAFTSEGRIDAPSYPVDVISTVGAGDSFNAGFFAAIAGGSSPAEALRFANAVAALVISSPRGVLDGPSLASVHDLLTPS